MSDNMPTPSAPQSPTPPKNNPHQKPRWSFSLWRFVMGGLIILFGAQLLAQNYGWNWTINFDPIRIWPILLILVGLSLITKGRVVSTVVGSLLALSVIAIAAVIMITQPAPNRETVSRSIQVSREAAATAAVVQVDLGAADINIRGGSSALVSGRFESNIGDLALNSSLNTTEQIVTINTTRERRSMMWFGSFKNTLDLQLPNDLPVDLDLDTGAASLDLDLSTVQTRRVTLDAGASSIDLTLSDLLANQTVTISSGASSIDIAIPKSLTGVRLSLDAGLSGKTLLNELKKVSDGRYETDGYSTAEKKLDLQIDAGASSINIHWK